MGQHALGKPRTESGSGTRARQRTEFRRPPGDGARVPPPLPRERTAQVIPGGARVVPPSRSARGQAGRAIPRGGAPVPSPGPGTRQGRRPRGRRSRGPSAPGQDRA